MKRALANRLQIVFLYQVGNKTLKLKLQKAAGNQLFNEDKTLELYQCSLQTSPYPK